MKKYKTVNDKPFRGYFCLWNYHKERKDFAKSPRKEKARGEGNTKVLESEVESLIQGRNLARWASAIAMPGSRSSNNESEHKSPRESGDDSEDESEILEESPCGRWLKRKEEVSELSPVVAATGRRH